MLLSDLTLQDNGIPIYVQLHDQIAAAVGRGILPPGARLPTMREVAVALSIDLNTVQRAYAELEREGILMMVRGRGSFVADSPPPPPLPDIRAFAEIMSAQAQAQGIGLDDLITALKRLSQRSS
jgi:GntR family transcriptional regulator